MQALDGFLADVERRAFRMARLATRNDADALDIVQDAMLALVSHYRDHPADQWRPLFYRCLENRILDWHRREKKQRRWFSWPKAADEDDVEAELPEHADDSHDPLQLLTRQLLGEQLLQQIEALPLQQQQCFLLRCWEGLSVADTALALCVSEGSVKTHYYRAMQKLQVLIQEQSE